MPTTEPDRQYLIYAEQRIVQVRFHWAKLFRPAVQTLILFVVAALVMQGRNGSFVRTWAAWVVVIALLRFGWKVATWWVRKFVLTDKRVMITSGLIDRKVAIMQLNKLTDMVYEQGVWGQFLGFATFTTESSGQDQAFHYIKYVPNPYEVYQQLSQALYPPMAAPPDPLV